MGQDLTLLNTMMHKMDWLEARQKELAQNIANADTPGFQPRDLKPVDFKAMLGRTASSMAMTGLATPNADHLTSGGKKAGTSAQGTQKSRETYEVSPAGNAVVLEEQLLKMNQTVTDHQFISNLYQKQIDMLEMATGKK